MSLFFKIAAILIYIWIFLIAISIVFKNFGIVLGIIAIIIFPITIPLIPWYEFFVNGNFLPLLLTYVGGFIAFFLFSA